MKALCQEMHLEMSSELCSHAAVCRLIVLPHHISSGADVSPLPSFAHISKTMTFPKRPCCCIPFSICIIFLFPSYRNKQAPKFGHLPV